VRFISRYFCSCPHSCRKRGSAEYCATAGAANFQIRQAELWKRGTQDREIVFKTFTAMRFERVLVKGV
jgi:hypothetical protein